MIVDAVHKYKCPGTVMGKKSGPCSCGADAMNQEFLGILKRLRKAAR